VSTVSFASHVERLVQNSTNAKPIAALDKGARNRIEEMLIED
jgi:hypothetical protein